MDAVSLYSFASLGWLGVQALPLIAWPGFVGSLLASDYRPADSVEVYFARSLGFAQLALGLVVVCLSGALPLDSMVDNPAEGITPYASAVILLTTLHHAAAGFYSYARYAAGAGGAGAYLAGWVGSGALAALGLWVLLFAGGRGHVSRRTGADKRTSGFPFRNAVAGKRRPKEP